MSWLDVKPTPLTIPQVRAHVTAMKFDLWRPSFMVIHNTAAPSLAQWYSSSREQRMLNLIDWYKNKKGWPSGPHAFVDDVFVWTFTPFNQKGTHSPSWNGTSIGIEFVGDYAREDDDAGPGLKVKQNAIALFAILHERLGIDPNTIRLHKEDKRTDHDCPGKDLAADKGNFIEAVQEYMGHGGEHPEVVPVAPEPPPPTKRGTVIVPADDVLNMRAQSSASSVILARLKPGSEVVVRGEAMNGKTKWLRIDAAQMTGWVAARFVQVVL